jgi:hypothetical protein
VTTGKPWFARAFDLPAVLSHWSVGLSPDRIHVVTVPQVDASGGDPDLLWERFCQAFVIDPAWAPLESDRSNASLGSAETQVLRRLNQRISRETRRDAMYDDLILGMLAADTLAGSRSRPILLPPKLHDWAVERGEAWIEWLEESGVDVVGDVKDLLPAPPAEDFRHPDRVRPRPQLDAALDALAAMTREAASRPDPETTVRGRLRRVRELRRR